MRWWALLPTRGEVSGSTHPDTLAARADLAQWTELASGSDGWVEGGYRRIGPLLANGTAEPELIGPALGHGGGSPLSSSL